MSNSSTIDGMDRAWMLNPATRLMDFVSIRLTDVGFHLLNEDRIVEVVDVRCVTQLVAFKRDLLTSDCICLRLERANADPVIVHEEMPGFTELFSLLTASFSGLDPNWYSRVMLPAFRANETMIWQAD